jgi:hypothetical protein
MAKHSKIPGMIEKIVQSRPSVNITFRDETFLCDILQKLIKNGENIRPSAEETGELNRRPSLPNAT